MRANWCYALFYCRFYLAVMVIKVMKCTQLKNVKTLKKAIQFTQENFTRLKSKLQKKNIVDKELLELRDTEYTWDKEILKYEDIRFKQCITFRNLAMWRIKEAKYIGL